ncbi:NAD-dependent epimerase/dehydratase family protein [Microbacterium aurum]
MSGRTLVVTGANGFVGGHVVRLARAAGHRVWAVGREPAASADIEAACDRYIAADLSEGWPIAEPVDAVIHLAGLAAVGPSFAEPQRYLSTNSAIVTSMCESLLALSPTARVVVVSSGAVYAPTDIPVTEDDASVASSPYAVSKLLVELQAEYYARRGLDTVVARPFNHIGPGQGSGFLVPDLTAALRALRPGEALTVGNLDTARDYTDVRDVARAYLLLAFAEAHERPLYNIASGSAHTGREVLAVIADELGVAVPSLRVDEGRLRPGDPLRITGSAERLHAELGWTPTIDWATSVRESVRASTHSS